MTLPGETVYSTDRQITADSAKPGRKGGHARGRLRSLDFQKQQSELQEKLLPRRMFPKDKSK